eukprot:1160037-Pelagomonas_calceolata.AAC.10
MPPSHGNEGHGGHSESQSLGENTVRGCAGLGCCVCGGMPVFSGGMLETKSHWPERRNTPAKHRLPALAQSKEGGPGFFLFYDVGTDAKIVVHITTVHPVYVSLSSLFSWLTDVLTTHADTLCVELSCTASIHVGLGSRFSRQRAGPPGHGCLGSNGVYMPVLQGTHRTDPTGVPPL